MWANGERVVVHGVKLISPNRRRKNWGYFDNFNTPPFGFSGKPKGWMTLKKIKNLIY
jgi:hypothetical protein